MYYLDNISFFTLLPAHAISLVLGSSRINIPAPPHLPARQNMLPWAHLITRLFAVLTGSLACFFGSFCGSLPLCVPSCICLCHCLIWSPICILTGSTSVLCSAFLQCGHVCAVCAADKLAHHTTVALDHFHIPCLLQAARSENRAAFARTATFSSLLPRLTPLDVHCIQTRSTTSLPARLRCAWATSIFRRMKWPFNKRYRLP